MKRERGRKKAVRRRAVRTSGVITVIPTLQKAGKYIGRYFGRWRAM